MQTKLPWPAWLRSPVMLEYDGNSLTFKQSHKVQALGTRRYPHFDGADRLGDVVWS